MHISQEQVVCGYPAIAMRNLFRKYPDGFTFKDLYTLGFGFFSALNLIHKFIEDGYIEPESDTDRYQLTVQGNALRMASTSRQIYRKTAERLMTEFLERVRELNANSSYACEVAKVLVFGSYITDAERLTDIDLAIEFVPRASNYEEFAELALHRVRVACGNGKHFKSIEEARHWPLTECKRFLRGRSSRLSLHESEEPILLKTDYRVLFEKLEVSS